MITTVVIFHFAFLSFLISLEIMPLQPETLHNLTKIILMGKIPVFQSGNNCVTDINECGSFTIDFWARRNTFKRSYDIMAGDSITNQSDLYIGFRENNILTFALNGNELDTYACPDQEWHHWTCVYDSNSNQQLIYRDGNQVAERTMREDAPKKVRLLHTNYDSHVPVHVAQIRRWNRALSSNEVEIVRVCHWLSSLNNASAIEEELS